MDVSKIAICRVCFKLSEDMVDLSSSFNIEEHKKTKLLDCAKNIFSDISTYMDCYRNLIKLEAPLKAHLFDKLCKNCTSKLLIAYSFTNRAQRAEEKLRETLTRYKEPITSINQEADELIDQKICEDSLDNVHVIYFPEMEETFGEASEENVIEDEFINKNNAHIDNEEDEFINKNNEHIDNEFEKGSESDCSVQHEGKKPTSNEQKCEICGKIYLKTSYLLLHMKKHVKIIDKQNPEAENAIELKSLEEPEVEETFGETSEKNVVEDEIINRNNAHIDHEFEKSIESDCSVQQEGKEPTSKEQKCNICGKIYLKKFYLLLHMKKHKIIDEPNPEAQDPFKLKSLKVPEKQIKKENNEKKSNNRQRKTVTERKEYGTRHALPRHKVDKHLRDKTNTCKQCGKKFTRSDYLRNHLKRHDVDREKFPCDQCDKIYFSTEALKVHKRLHTGNLIPCEVCNKGFVSKRELNVHRRFHTRDFPYVCEICGKKFAIVGHLNEHLFKHQGIKIECQECGKQFKLLKSFKEHSFIHIGKMPYPCSYCKRGYPSKQKYKFHLKQTHGIQLSEEELSKSRDQSATQSLKNCTPKWVKT